MMNTPRWVEDADFTELRAATAANDHVDPWERVGTLESTGELLFDDPNEIYDRG